MFPFHRLSEGMLLALIKPVWENEGDREAVAVRCRMASVVRICYCLSGFGLPPVEGEDQRPEFRVVSFLGLLESNMLLLFTRLG